MCSGIGHTCAPFPISRTEYRCQAVHATVRMDGSLILLFIQSKMTICVCVHRASCTLVWNKPDIRIAFRKLRLLLFLTQH